MRFAAIFTIVALLCFVGCDDDDDNVSGNSVTVNIAPAYTGTLDYSRLENGFRIDRTDSVTLTISQYTYLFTHHTDNTRLCDTEGEITINTQTGFVTLDPSSSNVGGGSCDTLRIPTGVFRALFTDSTLDMDTSRVIRNVDGEVIDTAYYEYRLKAVPSTSASRL